MAYDNQNIFAKIIRGEIPCNKVYENEHVLAFHDIAPAAPVHILVLPKGKYVSFDDFAASATANEVGTFFKALQYVAEQQGLRQGLRQDGYRVIMNHGANASQTVPHFHAHILGGKQLGALLTDDKLVR